MTLPALTPSQLPGKSEILKLTPPPRLAPGRMLFLQNVGDGSRLFLPFADDDPQSVEVLSKVLLLAEDHAIRDPGFLQQVSK